MSALDEQVVDVEMEETLDAIFDTVSTIDHPDIDGFSLAIESPPPAPTRAPRVTKVVLAWEEYLSFLTDMPGQWVKVFEFSESGIGKDGEEITPKQRAQARRRSMDARLKKTQPGQIWEVKIADDDGLWKVYAQFVRPATPAEVADREAKHEEAVARGLHAAEVRAKQRAQAAA